MKWPEQVFFSAAVDEHQLYLEGQEAVHCSLVLRKKEGDTISVINGNGFVFTCTILQVLKNRVVCSIESKEFYEQQEHLTLAVAPVKNRERMEWMVEKLVEIGLKQLIFMQTERTVRSKMAIDRLNRKALSAVKQSQRVYIPSIISLEFSKVLNLKTEHAYIAHCNEQFERSSIEKHKKGEYLLLIGPEGDFTSGEIEQAQSAGFTGLNLGNYRLRTETAAILTASKLS